MMSEMYDRRPCGYPKLDEDGQTRAKDCDNEEDQGVSGRQQTHPARSYITDIMYSKMELLEGTRYVHCLFKLTYCSPPQHLKGTQWQLED